jgi:DNA-binding response OmpR family regulator
MIVDDEDDVLDMLETHLTRNGFCVIKARTGADALKNCRNELPALIVLDIGIPELDGFEVCKGLKAEPKTAGIPIVMLTARSNELDRVLSFELGVDDYVTKPFSPRELTLRINSILRRRVRESDAPRVRVAGDIRLDEENYSVSVGAKRVTFTPVEFKLLQVLMRQAGRTLRRELLLESIRGNDTDVGLRAIDTHIRRLREKLGRAGKQIVTVRSFGYRLDEA